MRLSEVAAQLGVGLPAGDCEFSAISTDTRRLKNGQLFIALRGENFDGHDYVDAALNSGACGCIVERSVASDRPHIVVPDSTLALGVVGALQRKRFTKPLIAVTGSCGKTTVKGMLREILACQGSVLATEGNLNNHIGVPLTLMNLQNQDHAVVELGTSSPGEIGYLAHLIQPDVAVVTNVAAAHIGGFENLDAIANEKGQVYAPLQPHQVAVINGNDAYAPQFIKQTRDRQQFIFSIEKQAPLTQGRQLWAENIRALDGLPSFDIAFEGQLEPISLQVLGRHNVYNALAAAACALAAGVSFEAIKLGLSQFQPEKGRMQAYRLGQVTLVDDSYNANPKSVKAAIDFLAEQPASATYLVLGNMAELGSYSRDAHQDIGRHARSQNLTGLYTLGEDAALAAKEFGARGHSCSSKEELVKLLEAKLNEPATILVKGSRSARMEEVVAALRALGASKC